MPSHHKPLSVAKIYRGDLGVLIQIGIGGEPEGADGVLTFGVHVRIGHRLVGRNDGHDSLPIGAAVVAGIGVQGVDHGGGAVRQHSGLDALDGGVGAGAVVQGLDLAPFAALIDFKPNGVLLVEAGEIGGTGGADLAPSGHDPTAAGCHHRGQIRGAVVGEPMQGPAVSIAGSCGDNLGGVHLEHLLTLVQSAAVTRGQGKVLHLTHPHGGITAVGTGHLHAAVTVAYGNAVVFAVKADALLELPAALGRHGHTGVGEVLGLCVCSVCGPVAEIEHDSSVIGQHRIGVGVGPGLEDIRQRGALILVQAEQAHGGSAAQPDLLTGVHIVPALHLRAQVHGVHDLTVGHGHPGDGPAVDGLVGRPDLLDGIPVANLRVKFKAHRAEHLFIADEQELEDKLNAGGAGEAGFQAFQFWFRSAGHWTHGADVAVSLQIGPGERLEVEIQVELAEHADLAGHHREVEADAGKGPDIQEEPYRAKVIVGNALRVGALRQLFVKFGFAASALQAIKAAKAAVDGIVFAGGDIQADLQRAAQGHAGRDRDGAYQRVEIPGVVQPAAHMEAAADGAALPCAGLVVIGDIRLEIAA